MNHPLSNFGNLEIHQVSVEDGVSRYTLFFFSKKNSCRTFIFNREKNIFTVFRHHYNLDNVLFLRHYIKYGNVVRMIIIFIRWKPIAS